MDFEVAAVRSGAAKTGKFMINSDTITSTVMNPYRALWEVMVSS
jgi:hypothetical protein